MPAYSGVQYKVIVRAPWLDANVEIKSVTDREWESSFHQNLDDYPFHKILGRMRNLEVELFENYPILREHLESLDYKVHPFDPSQPLSIYPNTTFHQRNANQRLQDQLWLTLRNDKGHVAYALIAGTKSEYLLFGELDREAYDETSMPETMTCEDTVYPVIGYILDGVVTIFAPEKEIKKYLRKEAPFVLCKWYDKTSAAVEAREAEAEVEAEKERLVKEHKAQKRRKQKVLKQGGKSEVVVSKDGKKG